MLRSLDIQNFRCIHGATINFEPLTVLVGPNGSGKSTVLRALQPAQRHASERFHRGTDPVVINAVRDDGLTCTWSEGGVAGRAWQSQLLHLDVERMRQQNQAAHQSVLNADGSNLVNVFASLPRRVQSALAADLCKLVPTFADVDFGPTNGGHQRLQFQDRWSKILYEPDEVSDGTMLLVAYLTLQHQDPAPDILAIEEPDRGLHPYLVGQLIDFLRKLTTGAVGPKAVQVVLATHSAELLDFVRPEEVRFLSRDPKDGGLVVRKVDTGSVDWQDAYREYSESLGAVWLSGGLGGVPGDGLG